MYRAVYHKDDLSKQTEQARVRYGQEHLGKTVEDFWQWVYFTDEFHLDPTSQRAPRVLREQGTRYQQENIVARPPKQGIVLHCAGWVNWHAKCEFLEFYHDETYNKAIDEATQTAQQIIEDTRDPRPGKPRRRPTTETEIEFTERLRQWQIDIDIWEASIPELNPKSKGHSMTQKYYTDRLLPVYIDAIRHAEERHHHKFLLVEDGDSSHGIRKAGLAQRRKDANSILNLVHPASSPDLNPSEAAWNIFKQRIRQIRGLREMSIDQLKETANKVWSGISLEQIRSRIKEMPDRCRIVVENGGKRIKGMKW
jgi:hypothetical protein